MDKDFLRIRHQYIRISAITKVGPIVKGVLGNTYLYVHCGGQELCYRFREEEHEDCDAAAKEKRDQLVKLLGGAVELPEGGEDE